MKKLLTLTLLLGAITASATEFVILQKKHHKTLVHSAQEARAIAKKSKFQQNLYTKRPGNSEFFTWFDPTNTWMFEEQYEYVYNSDGNIALAKVLDQNGNQTGQIIYVYDSQKRLTLLDQQYKVGGSFESFAKDITAYNAEGDLILTEQQMKVNGNWEIVSGQKIDIQYDLVAKRKSTMEINHNGQFYDTSILYHIDYESMGGKIIREETEFYVGDGVFEKMEQSTYLFDAQGTDTGILKRIWDGTQWTDQLLYCEYQYDSPQKDFLSGTQIYLKLGSTWMLFQRERFERDANGLFSYLLEDFLGNSWQGNMRVMQQLDAMGNILEYKYDLFMSGTWQALFAFANEFSYDIEGNLTEHIFKESDSQGSYKPVSKQTFSNFSNTTGIGKTTKPLLSIYPNPSDDYISIADLSAEEYELRIYNQEGKLMLQTKARGYEKISISALPSGFYIVRSADKTGRLIKR